MIKGRVAKNSNDGVRCLNSSENNQPTCHTLMFKNGYPEDNQPICHVWAFVNDLVEKHKPIFPIRLFINSYSKNHQHILGPYFHKHILGK